MLNVVGFIKAPAFDELSTSNEILETGIKVIDLLAPYQKVVKSDFSVVPVLVKPS